MLFIFEFFKQLFRSRVEGVKISAKGKIYSVQSRARSKAASAFNRPIDRAMAKAKSGVKGKIKEVKHREEKKKMGFFSFFKKKKVDEELPPGEEETSDDMKTQAINVEAFSDERAKEVLGWLVALNGLHKGKDFRLYNGKNVIGTAADCDIVLTDQYLSAHHATIRHENGEWTIQDLDSTNGSYVNQKRVYKANLIDNDTIRVGRIELRFKSLY